MLDDFSLRLLAAGALTIGLARWHKRRSEEKLRRWTSDPAGMRARTIALLEKGATAVAYIGAAVLCFGITLCVELMVALVRRMQ